MQTRYLPARHVVAIAIALIVILAGACSTKNETVSTSPTSATIEIPSSTDTLPPTTTAPPVETNSEAPALITPYFIRDGQIAAGQKRTVTGPAVGHAAVQELITGPGPFDAAQGLTTALAHNVTVNSVRIADGIATIDLSRPFETANTRPQVAQVVFTLTQFESVDAVKFLIDGEPNGATGVMAISRNDLEDVTPPIFVDSPTPGSILSSTFTVTGTANTFEANVPWQVVGAEGQVIAQGAATASSGNGERGDFSITIDVADYRGQASIVTWTENMESGGIEELPRTPIEIQD